MVGYREIPIMEHKQEEEWFVQQEPTCTYEGTKVKRCVYCGETIKVEKIPLIIDKGKLTFVYKIHSEQNPFILPAEGGRFESPFTCKKQTYLNGQFIEETYSSLNGLRFKTISSGNVWFLTVRKDGEKIGFYKFSFVGEGPYNQKTDPECYFNIYTHDADLITDNPTEIFRQDFIQPQTPGEDYYKPSRSSYKHGTFDF